MAQNRKSSSGSCMYYFLFFWWVAKEQSTLLLGSSGSFQKHSSFFSWRSLKAIHGVSHLTSTASCGAVEVFSWHGYLWMFNLWPQKVIDYIISYKKQEWPDSKSILSPYYFCYDITLGVSSQRHSTPSVVYLSVIHFKSGLLRKRVFLKELIDWVPLVWVLLFTLRSWYRFLNPISNHASNLYACEDNGSEDDDLTVLCIMV